jgi:hypothetical protein
MRPIAQPDGHDAPGLLDEAVPVVAAVIDEVVVVAEHRFDSRFRTVPSGG